MKTPVPAPPRALAPKTAAARFQRRLARLPGLSKLAWTNINVEYDPFKYGSFPVRSGEEIYGLTRLRYNPFHLYLASRLAAFVEKVK